MRNGILIPNVQANARAALVELIRLIESGSFPFNIAQMASKQQRKQSKSRLEALRERSAQAEQGGGCSS